MPNNEYKVKISSESTGSNRPVQTRNVPVAQQSQKSIVPELEKALGAQFAKVIKTLQDNLVRAINNSAPSSAEKTNGQPPQVLAKRVLQQAVADGIKEALSVNNMPSKNKGSQEITIDLKTEGIDKAISNSIGRVFDKFLRSSNQGGSPATQQRSIERKTEVTKIVQSSVKGSNLGEIAAITSELKKIATATSEFKSVVSKLEGIKGGNTSDLKNLESLLQKLVDKRTVVTKASSGVQNTVKTMGLDDTIAKQLLKKLDELKSISANPTKVLKEQGGLNTSSILVKKLDSLISAYNKKATTQEVKVKIENEFRGSKTKFKELDALVSAIERLDKSIAYATKSGANVQNIGELKKGVRTAGSDIATSGKINEEFKFKAVSNFAKSFNKDIENLAKKDIKLKAVVEVDVSDAERSLQKLSKSKYKVDIANDNLVDLYNKLESIGVLLNNKSKLTIDADFSGLEKVIKSKDELRKLLRDMNDALREFDNTKGKLFSAVMKAPEMQFSKEGKATVGTDTKRDKDFDLRLKNMATSYNKLAAAYDKDVSGGKYDTYKSLGQTGQDKFRRTNVSNVSSIDKLVKALESTDIKSLFESPTTSSRASESKNTALGKFKSIQKQLEGFDTDALQKSLNALAVQSDKNAKELGNIFSTTSAKAFKESEKAAKKLAEKQDALMRATEANIEATKANTTAKIQTTEGHKQYNKIVQKSMATLTSHRDTLTGINRFDAGPVRPGKEYTSGIDKKFESGFSNKYEEQVYDRAKKLSLSLERLQKNIYEEISKGLIVSSQQNKFKDKWSVSGSSPQKAFKLRGRQWGMDIANVSRLQALTGTDNKDAGKLMSSYKTKLSKKMFGKGGSGDVTKMIDENADKIAKWIDTNLDLDTLSLEMQKAFGDALTTKLSQTKGAGTTAASVKDVVKTEGSDYLAQLYGATAGSKQVRKRMSSEGVVKTLSLPAAKVSASGGTTLETQHGRQRSMAQYSDYKTGYERAFDVYLKNNAEKFKSEKGQVGLAGMARSVKRMSSGDAPFKGSKIMAKGQLTQATNESVIKTLISNLAVEGKQDKSPVTVDEIKSIYEQALIPISIEKQRITKGTDDPLKATDVHKKLQSGLDKVVGVAKTNKPGEGQAQIDEVMTKMAELGVSGHKVIKSLDKIEFSNFYDMLDIAISDKLNKISTYINSSERGVRNYEKSITQLETLMPLVEGNAPRRAMHQGNVVNTLSKTSKVYSAEDYLTNEKVKKQYLKETRSYDEPNTSDVEYQKSTIRDFNKTYRDLFYESSQLSQFEGQPAAQQRRSQLDVGKNTILSSLGLPESTSGTIADFSRGTVTGLDTKEQAALPMDQLKSIKGSMIPMYSGELHSLAPFGAEFQQTGRNISNVTAAKSFDPQAVPGLKSSLQSQLPSLRSKQEQDVIQSGRYGTGGYGYNVTAELSHTSGTFEDQILVSGDLANAITSLTKKLVKPAAGPGTSQMESKVLADTLSEDISQVSKEIMKVMGVTDKYKGRADKALLKSVNETMSTVRGEDVDVQTAEIAEAFMNHFGRKFTTRYGSKGVSMSPAKPQNMASILEAYKGDKAINVLTPEEKKKAGLGVAMMPKSAGEMTAEMFDSTISEELHRTLLESGNKFVLELFKDASKGLVTKEEAKKNRDTFYEISEATSGSGVDVSSFKSIKESYKEKTDQSEFKATPIDVRISSLGAGKRGLQGEVLEMVTGNVAGGVGGSTVLKDKPEFGKLLGSDAGSLSESSSKLGYTGTGKSSKGIRSAIEKMYGEKAGENKDFIDSLVKLEEESSFYVDVIDEFGNKRKSLVGKKFVQIIEEAKQFEEWSKGSIDSGAKGLKLNIPAYAAYTSVFGKDSAIMKQINSSIDEKQAEAQEKIVAYLASTNEDFKNRTLKGLQSKELSTIGSFEGTFGSMDPSASNTLSGTVFDTDELSSAFKTSIYSGAKDVEGKGTKEDLYIPKSILRSSFDDPMVAGGRGVSLTGRKLSDLVNKARSLEAYETGATSTTNEEEEKAYSMLLDADKGAMERTLAPKLISNLQNKSSGVKRETLQKLIALADEKASSESGLLSASNLEMFKTAFPEQAEQPSQKLFTQHLSSLEGSEIDTLDVKQIKELLLGGYGDSEKSILGTVDKGERFDFVKEIASITGMDFKTMAGAGSAEKDGKDAFQRELEKKRQAVKDAKSAYSENLQGELTGKKGAVAQTLFTRKVPAVLAKATQATVDKTDDLSAFTSTLKAIESNFKTVMQETGISSFKSDIESIESITLGHVKNLEKLKAVGMPVLKQHELGVPEKLAGTLSMDFTKAYDVKTGTKMGTQQEVSGTLKDLLKYIEQLKATANKGINTEEISNYIDKALVPYVESVRFPFTGTSSLQPYKAKLLETREGVNQDTLMVPGVPEMDMAAFDKVYSNIKSKRDIAVTERESYRTGGQDEKANKLTKYIDVLNKAISDVIPKYVAQAQKLDFDGDQIEIHTATTKAAREDIRKHFDLLTNDVDSTAGRFRDAFTYDAKQPSQGDVPLAFMGKAFSKKFGPEKGFDYMKQPFMTETLDYFSPAKKIELMAGKKVEEGKSTGEAVAAVVNKAVLSAGVGEKGLLDPKEFKGLDTLEAVANAAAAAISDMSEKGLIQGYLKEELLNIKWADAVNAQLFKIHTGKEVEGMTKLMRAYEAPMGFGGGETALKGSSKSLDQDFLLRERQTQMNELYRFAVQKGMDVKHAGEQTVASDIMALTTTGKGGVEDLISRIGKDDNFGGLQEFSEENAKSLENRFGRYSTEDLRTTASKEFGVETGADVSREELVNKLIAKLGFEGFLRDLQQEIEKQALDALSKMEGKDGKPIGMRAARTQLEEGYGKGKPINVSRFVTNEQDPLYKLRTSSPGKVGQTNQEFSNELIKMLSSVKEDNRKGTYSEMTKGFRSMVKATEGSFDMNSLRDLYNTTANTGFDTKDKTGILSSVSKKVDKLETLSGVAPASELWKENVKGTVGSAPEGYTDEQAKNFQKFSEKRAVLSKRIERLASSVQNSATAPTMFDIEGLTPEIISTREDKKKIAKTETPKLTEEERLQQQTLQADGGGALGGMAFKADFSDSGPLDVIIKGINTGDLMSVAVISSQVKSLVQSGYSGGTSTGDDVPLHFKAEDTAPTRSSKTDVEAYYVKTQKQAEEARIKEATEESRTLSPYSGYGPSNQLKNLELLRGSALMTQPGGKAGFEESLEMMPEDVKGMLEKAKTGDTTPSKFFEFLDNKQIEEMGKEEPELDHAKIAQSWKLFKDARIEFLINKAKEAKDYFKQTESLGDDKKSDLAYEGFKTSVERVQSQIKADVGKSSDIYTQNNVWGQSGIAKAAGVYMSPREVQQKASKGLDYNKKGDIQLAKVFDTLTKDLSGEERDTMKSPIEKSRYAVSELTDMNKESAKLMESGALLERLGPEIAEAWDFKKGVQSITRLREMLEMFKKFNVSDSPLSVEKKNLDSTIKMLKDAENKMSYLDLNKQTAKSGAGEWGSTGVLPIPKWMDAKTQDLMNKRNVVKIQDYMKRPEAEGGAKVGEKYIYNEKVFDQAGTAIKNNQQIFTKYKEVIDATGATVGKFANKQNDLIDAMSGANRGFTGAIKRAVMWGAASSVVYGGFSQLKESIGVLADIEIQVASLRMVMNPLTTDFESMSAAAVDMAKTYGVGVGETLSSMKVYAQQGLSEPEILDRTKTSTLAANVTTLDSKDATEALTAAMKIFRTEGEESMAFLDSWSEVESKHAITAGDLADAIKKAASAASTAGISFHELNGIVATIGSTTRQSGKEVGTSMRFIMRRLSSEKGPQELGKMGISTVTGEGGLKGGFDILDELAGKWDDLTGAQQMNMAQAIGGTRQYNSLIVLMDNWAQALQATKDSQNSKGSAERKNIEIMKTYAKQVEQTKASLVELQMSVGKAAFPIFKGGLAVVRNITEALSGIPAPIKAAGAAAVALFTYLAKGSDIIKSIGEFFSSGTPIIGDLIGTIGNELKTASFEILGAGSGDFTKGLKTVTKDSDKGIKQGIQLTDFHSTLGKTAHLIYSAGQAFNSAVGTGLKGTAKAGDITGGGMKSVGNFLSIISSMSIGKEVVGGGLKGKDTTMRDVGERAVGLGVTAKGVKEAFSTKALGKLAGSGVALAGEVVGLGTTAAGLFVESFSKKLGSGGDMFKKWASDNSGFVEAIAPMALTLAVMAPAVKELGTQFAKTTRSSQDFEKSMYGVRRANEGSLKAIRDNSSSYSKLVKGFGKLEEDQSPERVTERKRLGTYKSPVLEMAEKNKEATKFANELANTNVSLVAGYDELGNVVLRTSKNFENLFTTLKKSKIKEMAGTEVSVAAKHVQSLTQSDGSEKWKYELKSLMKEVPVFGDLLSRQIKVSPAKQMKEATKKLNILTAKKGQYSLTTAFDEDVKDLQEKLDKVRAGFNETYLDFKNTLANIQLDGLSPQEISKILGDKELRAGYKLMLDIEPEYNLKGIKDKIKWEDVLGAEVMTRSFESSGNLFGATKELTSANIESAGIEQRQGKLLSGDLVTFTDDAAKKFDMSGGQAIVQMKETSDGIFNWVASYFNTKTLKVEERVFDSSMQNLVESILPTRAIEKDLSDRIEALNEFTAGAGAGLRGISAKDFKSNFSLGERFFSDIASSSIIQGDKGFTPTAGFGESPFQEGWGSDFEKYYAKPVEKYRFLLEKLQKMNMAGVGSDQVKMTTELYDELSELQNILKNNQVVMQYRAAFADLTKTLEANTRATSENLKMADSRLSLTKETAGLMKGKNKELAELDLGVQDKSKLTAQQRLLISNPEFEDKAKQLKKLEIERAGTAEGIYATDKTQVALDSIKAVSKGFGSELSPEEMQKYTETVAKTGDLGIAELKIDTSETADNTADTVDRLDQLIERFDKQGGVEDMSNSINDFVGVPNGLLDSLFTGVTNPSETERISEALDRVAGIRDSASATGDSETLIKSNRALDLLVERLIKKQGVQGAANVADRGFAGKGAFTSDELYSRAFAGMDTKTLMSEMKEVMPDEKKWFGLVSKGGTPEFDKQVSSLYDLQEKNKQAAAQPSILSSKNLAGATASATMYGAFSRDYTNKRIEAMESDITKNREAAVKAGKSVMTSGEGGTEVQLKGKYKEEEDRLLKLKSEESRKAKLYGTVQAMAGTSTASTLFARNMGMGDNMSKMAGVTGSAVGAYGAAKMQTGMTKDDLPENFKKFQQDLFKYGEDASDSGGGVLGKAKQGWAAFNLRGASKDLMKSIAEESMGLTEVKETEKPKTYTENIKEASEFTSKKMSEVSDRIVAALEKNSEATNKNTDSKFEGVSTEEKSFGGSIQSFNTGGTIRNTSTIAPEFIPPGISKKDDQLILGQIGELVIPKDKVEQFKKYQSILEGVSQSGKKYANGGQTISSNSELQSLNENIDFVTKNKEFEETDKDAKMVGNLAKFGLIGAGTVGAGAYALKGYEDTSKLSALGKVTNAKDIASKKIKDFSIKDTWKNADKRIFANPFANVKNIPNDLKELKGMGGKGFGAGAATAGRIGMKSAGMMGAGLTLGFAANRFRKGDTSGALLETASAALSGTLIGSIGAVGIQAYLTKRDMNKSDLIKARKAELEEKLSALQAPKFAGGGLVSLVTEIAKLGWAGTKGVGKIAGGTSKLLAKGLFSKELITDVSKVAAKTKKGTTDVSKFFIDNAGTMAGKVKLPETLKKPVDLLGAYVSKAGNKTSDIAGKAAKYTFSENLISATKAGSGIAPTIGKAGLNVASGLAHIPAFALRKLSNFPKLHMAVATGALSYTAAQNMVDDGEGFSFGGNIQSKNSGVLGGVGTGTSDSNTMFAENGSFIIPSKHTSKAKRYLEGKNYSNGGNIRVSKGEYFISPEDVNRIGKENLERLRNGQAPKFANGGAVGNIGSSADQVDYNKVAQVAASATAATLARYVAEKDSQKVRAADLEGYAKGESSEISNILGNNAEAMQAVYDKINSGTDLKGTKTSEETEEVSKVLDSEKSFDKVSNDILKIRNNLEGTFNSTTEEIIELKKELADLELEEEFNMQLEDIKKSIKDANLAKDIKDSLKTGKGIFEGLSSKTSQIDLGQTSRAGMDKYQLLGLKRDRSTDKNASQRLGITIKKSLSPFDNIGSKISKSLTNSFKNLQFWKEKGDRGLVGKKPLNEYEKLEVKKNNQVDIIDASLSNRAKETTERGQQKWDKKIESAQKQLEKITKEQASWGDEVETEALRVAKSFKLLTDATELASELVVSRSKNKFDLQNAGMGGALKGTVSNLELIPNSVKDISQDQYDWKTAPNAMKNRMQAYGDTQTMYKKEQTNLDQLKQERVTVQAEYDQAPDKPILGGFFGYGESAAQKILDVRIKSLNESIASSESKLSAWGASLSESSKVIYTFKAVSSSLLDFERAVQTSKEVMADSRLGGQAADNALSEMYGGSSPFAPQFIDPYQKFKAAEVGVGLSLGESDQFDVKRANLLQQLNSGNVTGQQRVDLEQQLAFIPAEKESYRQAQQLQRESDKTNQNFAGTRDLAKRLAALSVDPGTDLTKEQRVKYEDLARNLNSRVTSAADRTLATGTGQTEDTEAVKELVNKIIESDFGGNEQDYIKVMGTDSDKQLQALGQQTDLLARILESLTNGKQGYTETLDDIGADAYGRGVKKQQKLKRQTEFATGSGGEDEEYPWGAKTGGQIGTMIKGPGTGTSDSISTTVPEGSFIVQSKYANKAKNTINGYANGGVPVNISNGELFLSPSEVQNIGGYNVANSLNAGKSFASGGLVLPERRRDQSMSDYFKLVKQLKEEHIANKNNEGYAKELIDSYESEVKQDIEKQKKSTAPKTDGNSVAGLDLKGGFNALKGKNTKKVIDEIFDYNKGGLVVTFPGLSEEENKAKLIELGLVPDSEAKQIGPYAVSKGLDTKSLERFTDRSRVDRPEKTPKQKLIEQALAKVKETGTLPSAGSKGSNLNELLSSVDKPFFGNSPQGENVYSNIFMDGGVRKLNQETKEWESIKRGLEETKKVTSTKVVPKIPNFNKENLKTKLPILGDSDLWSIMSPIVSKGNYSSIFKEGGSLDTFIKSGAYSINFMDVDMSEVQLKDRLKKAYTRHKGISLEEQAKHNKKGLNPKILKKLVYKDVEEEQRKIEKNLTPITNNRPTDPTDPEGFTGKYNRADYERKQSDIFKANVAKRNSVLTQAGQRNLSQEDIDKRNAGLATQYKSEVLELDRTHLWNRSPEQFVNNDGQLPSWVSQYNKDRINYNSVSDLPKERGTKYSTDWGRQRNLVGQVVGTDIGRLSSSMLRSIPSAQMFMGSEAYDEAKKTKLASSKSNNLTNKEQEDILRTEMSRQQQELALEEAKIIAMPQGLDKYNAQQKLKGKTLNAGANMFKAARHQQTLNKDFGPKRSSYVKVGPAGEDVPSRILLLIGNAEARQKALADGRLHKDEKSGQWYVDRRLGQTWLENTSFITDKQDYTLRKDLNAGRKDILSNLVEEKRYNEFSSGLGDVSSNVARSLFKMIGSSKGVDSVKDIWKFLKGGDSDIKGTMHTGGMVNNTGNYFLEKGELVVSKNLKNGGVAANNFRNYVAGGQVSSAGALPQASNNINTSIIEDAITKALASVELKVEDKKLSVDIGDHKIPVDVGDALVGVDTENVTVKVDTENATVMVDIENIKIPVDVSGVSIPVDTENATVKVDTTGVLVKVDVSGVSIPVDTENAAVKVETEGVVIPVEMPTEGLKVDASVLTSTLDNFANKLASITIDASSNSVGADKEDKLAGVLEELNSQISNLKEVQSYDIEMLNEKISKSGGDSRVSSIIEQQQLDNADLVRQINDIDSSIGKVVSDQDRRYQEIGVLLSDFNNKINTVTTKVYSVSAQQG